MQTTGGIYLNLEESSYKIGYGTFEFYFSSLFNLNRYKEKVINYMNLEESKIKNRYQIDKINLGLFFAIVYYTKIEKRGFRIIDLSKNIEYNKKEDIKLIVKIKE